MNLFLTHLASILEPEPHETMIKIPDIIDDQRLCELLPRAEAIIAEHSADPANQTHINGYRLADRMREIAKARRHEFVTRVMEDTPDGLEALRDINRAEQLAAHHLDMLDRLGGRPAPIAQS